MANLQLGLIRDKAERIDIAVLNFFFECVTVQ